MAAESIGSLVPTKIPGLSDQADIQAALRVYHYGSYTFDTAETDPAELVNPSIAYTLNDLQDQIDSVSGGSAIQATIVDAKGDIIAASAADTVVRLAVGSNGRVLTANSATATGLEWATPAVTLTNSVTLEGKSIALGSNTVTGTIAQFNTAVTDADFATLAGSEVLSNKELKSPTETMNIVASAATGTININAETSTIWYYTSNATANHTLNFRHSSSATLDSVTDVTQSRWQSDDDFTVFEIKVKIDNTKLPTEPKEPTPPYKGGRGYGRNYVSNDYDDIVADISLVNVKNC